MVKKEGEPGADFIEEWNQNPNFKNCLREEIECYKPKLIVFMSQQVEELFRDNFEDIEIETFRIYHPSYVFRRNKFDEWDKQFKKLKTKLR